MPASMNLVPRACSFTIARNKRRASRHKRLLDLREGVSLPKRFNENKTMAENAKQLLLQRIDTTPNSDLMAIDGDDNNRTSGLLIVNKHQKKAFLSNPCAPIALSKKHIKKLRKRVCFKDPASGQLKPLLSAKKGLLQSTSMDVS